MNLRVLSIWSITLLLACISGDAYTATIEHKEDLNEFRTWIAGMKADPRGPFLRIRWFCNDGSVLPPKAYACREHGGGIQHGEWNSRTQEIREQGFAIANVLAELSPEDVLTTTDNLLQQLLLEQFLINVDDGWILRQARFYRGAFQAENEEASARTILKALVMDEDWLEHRILLIYEAARLLPHGVASVELTKVRADAATLHAKDPGFSSLRNKIHGKPDPNDADSVRSYAKAQGVRELLAEYEALANAIESATDPARILDRLDTISQSVDDKDLKVMLSRARSDLATADTPTAQLRVASIASAQLRDRIIRVPGADDRLALIDAGIALDQSVFASSQVLRKRLSTATRREQIAWLTDLARALYGIGGLSHYEWQQFQKTAARLQKNRLDLEVYRNELKAMTHTPSWAQRRLALHFELAISHLVRLDALALEFIPDRLRGSSMLMYSAILDVLTADANGLAGVQHSFFGNTLSTGLRSLNPGVAMGVLMTEEDYTKDPKPGVPKILVVPETLADLPPVAGILTEHEGNHLSHVQLLARNLGIPNVVVDRRLQDQIEAHRGKPVALASSPGGIVSLSAVPASQFQAATSQNAPDPSQRIVVNVEKLDLDASDLASVSTLRSADSGVKVGPKAAKLGELMARYPGTVSAGLAIPFGAFRDLLNQEFELGLSAFDWLKQRYDALARTDDPVIAARYRDETLSRIREWISTVSLDPDFLTQLREKMAAEFGTEGSYGVFVRSDTNVEDLPGFTGAGLNLTVPNVVGFENTVAAIREVWASPFSDRAFGWRQALMDKPEHLYAAVLLHQRVNSDRSGVMVTSNIETMAQNEITVVTNEGVGGGVEGQSAETIVVHTSTGEVRLQSSATAPRKRVLLPDGGSELVPVTGTDRLLSEPDVKSLIDLAADIDTWLKDAQGARQVADVEFGFMDNELVLFQIRPFVESSAASSNEQLIGLDAPLRSIAAKSIDLTQATTSTQ